MANKPGNHVERLKREMHHTLDQTRIELDRIEILAAGLAAFSAPIPDYEPDFHHLRHVTARAKQL